MVTIVAYSYYSSPWEQKTGDDVRIHTILKTLATRHNTLVTNISVQVRNILTRRDGIVYLTIPRRFYRFIANIIKWKDHWDLNTLAKLTLYLDEFITLAKHRLLFRKADIIIVFGSMTLGPVILRMLGIGKPIIYDPLANYAQTLYLNSRKSVLAMIKYGVYLALHKPQLKSSTIVTYSSMTDRILAEHMFKVRHTYVLPNPSPICYQDAEEFYRLRTKKKEPTKPYFLLLAGSPGNKDAVVQTIEIFNNMPPSRYTLFITGPWQYLRLYVKNDGIKIVGTVPHEKLKELAAISDYGLSPIFSHAAGTLMKMLAYQAADLHIIASPHSLLGLDIRNPRKIRVVRNYEEYAKAIEEAIQNYKPDQERRPLTCEERDKTLQAQVDKLLSSLT